MTVKDEELAELRQFCPQAAALTEGGDEFVSLSAINIVAGKNSVTRDALLTLGKHSGYTSRLYLSEPIAGRGNNWTTHVVLGRQWHTPSWNNVLPSRPIEMLLQHLKVYQ